MRSRTWGLIIPLLTLWGEGFSAVHHVDITSNVFIPRPEGDPEFTAFVNVNVTHEDFWSSTSPDFNAKVSLSSPSLSDFELVSFNCPAGEVVTSVDYESNSESCTWTERYQSSGTRTYDMRLTSSLSLCYGGRFNVTCEPERDYCNISVTCSKPGCSSTADHNAVLAKCSELGYSFVNFGTYTTSCLPSQKNLVKFGQNRWFICTQPISSSSEGTSSSNGASDPYQGSSSSGPNLSGFMQDSDSTVLMQFNFQGDWAKEVTQRKISLQTDVLITSVTDVATRVVELKNETKESMNVLRDINEGIGIGNSYLQDLVERDTAIIGRDTFIVELGDLGESIEAQTNVIEDLGDGLSNIEGLLVEIRDGILSEGDADTSISIPENSLDFLDSLQESYLARAQNQKNEILDFFDSDRGMRAYLDTMTPIDLKIEQHIPAYSGSCVYDINIEPLGYSGSINFEDIYGVNVASLLQSFIYAFVALLNFASALSVIRRGGN